jgi:flavodoxin I
VKKALIIYGSTTGNTEYAAEAIGDYLKENDYSVNLINVTDTSVKELDSPYDLYFLGSSTWGEDEIELQEDFQGFYDDLNHNLSVSGKKYAVFGCGDSSYQYFCGAVDAIEEKISKLGGHLVCESLRIDGEPEKNEIKEWTQDVINAA